jgi:hypothetical protein
VSTHRVDVVDTVVRPPNACVVSTLGMDERARKVSELLHEAGETHHTVFRITDGADDDWASWYSDWLTRLSELPAVLGAAPVRSELTWLMVRLDKEHTEQAPAEKWEDWYAERVVAHFSAADGT